MVECVGKVNVEDHRKKRRVLHINMLQKWHPPVSAFLVHQVQDVHEEDIPMWNDNEGGQAKQGNADGLSQLY